MRSESSLVGLKYHLGDVFLLFGGWRWSLVGCDKPDIHSKFMRDTADCEMECLYELCDEVTPNHHDIFLALAQSHAQQLGMTTAISAWVNIQRPTIIASINHSLKTATNNIINIQEYFRSNNQQQNLTNINRIIEQRKKHLPMSTENENKIRLNKTIIKVRRKVHPKQTDQQY